MGIFATFSLIFRKFYSFEPVYCIRYPGKEFPVAGITEECNEVHCIFISGTRKKSFGLISPGACRLKVHVELLTPASAAVLRNNIEVHTSSDRIKQPFFTECEIALDKKIYIFTDNAVIESIVRSIIGIAMMAEVIFKRISLWPSACGILAFENEINCFVEGRFPYRIQFFKVYP